MTKGLWKSFFRTWKNHFTMQMATVSVLTGTYAVMTFAVLIYHNLDQVLGHWGESIQVSVYLKDSLPTQKIAGVQSKISGIEGVKSINFIDKDEAARRFQSQMSSYAPNFLSNLEFGNPLPRSFEVEVAKSKEGGVSFGLIKSIANKVQSMVGVDDVSYGQGWVENYASVVQSVGATSWLVVLVLLFGSLFVVGNSIRNSVAQRRDEIEILELFGATPSMIRGPYIFEGIAMGALSSAAAVLVCYFIFRWQAQIFGGELGFLGLNSVVSYLSAGTCLFLLFIGTAMGGLGSYLCVRHLSGGWLAAEASTQQVHQ